MRQAVSVVVVTDPTGRSVVMYVGPDRTGKLLEVGLNYDGDAVHAMDARKQFLPGFDRKRGKRRGMR
ncbi:MAG: hypothetical protein LBG11_10670 [Bifidobacteriaceae bacterium]|nr:hypothetical protein [Bifidobacteriaceae bacterium]